MRHTAPTAKKGPTRLPMTGEDVSQCLTATLNALPQGVVDDAKVGALCYLPLAA
jgi:hypothetical protein